jgi:hypothetical protein
MKTLSNNLTCKGNKRWKKKMDLSLRPIHLHSWLSGWHGTYPPSIKVKPMAAIGIGSGCRFSFPVVMYLPVVASRLPRASAALNALGHVRKAAYELDIVPQIPARTRQRASQGFSSSCGSPHPISSWERTKRVGEGTGESAAHVRVHVVLLCARYGPQPTFPFAWVYFILPHRKKLMGYYKLCTTNLH